MEELTKKELNEINGGASGALFTSVIRGAELILELGRSLGSSIRRFITKQYC